MNRWKAKPAIEGRLIPRQAAQIALMQMLDDLNALGELEDIVERAPSKVHAFGPKAIYGQVMDGPLYVGAVLWYRPVSYYHYRTLSLLGLWALQGEGKAQLFLGTRQLPYQAAYFSADSYFFHLSKGFEVYYGKEALPPDESARLWSASYEPEKRLEFRKIIAQALSEWNYPISAADEPTGQ